jgi:hypothetical protein
MPLALKYDTEATKLAIELLDVIVKGLKALPQELMNHGVAAMRESASRTFEIEGPGWALLAKKTIKDREREAKLFALPITGEHPILVRHGKMKASMVMRSPDTIEEKPTYESRPGVVEARLGTTDPKVAYHEHIRSENPHLPLRRIFSQPIGILYVHTVLNAQTELAILKLFYEAAPKG